MKGIGRIEMEANHLSSVDLQDEGWVLANSESFLAFFKEREIAFDVQCHLNAKVPMDEGLGVGIYPALVTPEGIFWLDTDDAEELKHGHRALRAALYKAEHWDD